MDSRPLSILHNAAVSSTAFQTKPSEKEPEQIFSIELLQAKIKAELEWTNRSCKGVLEAAPGRAGPSASEEAQTFNELGKLFIEPMQHEHMCLIAH